MSKFANILKMIIMLQSREIMKTQELAQEIEVSKRMIRKYKNDLEQAGIYINSAPGPNGGYRLEDSNFLNLTINKDEFAALHMGREYLAKKSGFMFQKEFDLALDKIKIAMKKNNDLITQGEYYNLDSKPKIKLEVEKGKYEKINEAIMMRKKISIEYISLSSGLNKRIIRPYAIFMYKNFWYFIAYCELRKEIREFKMVRVTKIVVLEDTFPEEKDFSLKKYMKNSFGVFNDAEFYLKLRIKYPRSVLVSERIWVKNQVITWQEDNSIIFEATMKGMPEIKNWVLGMGSKVEVIEPEELKQEIKEEIEKIKYLYNI